LCEVAEKYIEVKSRSEFDGQVAIMSWAHEGQQQYDSTLTNTIPDGSIDSGTHSIDQIGAKPCMNALSVGTTAHRETNWSGAELPNGLALPIPGDVDAEMNLSGAQLWDWFNKNQSIMRMLEGT
jgi:hypothetical protein